MKVLLHACCAPCLIYPQQVLKTKGFEIQVFFYNPNIHPFGEYKNRLQALEKFSQGSDDKIIYAEYDFQNFFRIVSNHELAPERCKLCWHMRLKKTAIFAKQNGFDFFSTTLMVSPYQDINSIKEIAQKISEEEKIKFYFEDFRPGFKKAHTQAKQEGIYCQKYCGCLYSERERYDSIKQHR